MRKLAFSFLGAAVLIAASALPVQAQDDGPNLVSVGTLSVTPAQSDQFADVVKKVVEAAKLSNLDAKHRWSVYQEGNDYRFVTWPENWAQLDDEGAFVREINAGEGATLMQEAFAEFSELWVTSSSQMAEMMPEWSYMPEDGLQPGDHTGAVVFETWVRPGKAEEYGENTAGVMAMIKEMGYPYPIFGHRVRLGDENLTYFVVLHDGLSDFYGEKSFGQFIEAAGIGEKWSEHFEARGQLIYDNNNYQAGWREDLSYLPDDDGS